MSTDASTPSTSALPVSLRVRGAEGDRLRTFVEGVLGWQPVDDGTAALVPPAVALVGPDVETVALRPRVLVVPPDCRATEAARAAARLRPDHVVAWPGDREQLPEVVSSLLARAPGAPAGEAADLRVAGAAGGVGTTTVALALGGLAAWSGQPALVLAPGAVAAPTGPPVPLDALTAPGTWERAHEAPGVRDLRVLRTAGAAVDARVAAEPARVVVRDVGVGDDADVLVLRRDAAGLAALPRAVAAVGVLVDDGPASARDLRAASGERRLLTVPHSVRVARAGLAGRVPAGLPGAWLRLLRPLCPRPDP